MWWFGGREITDVITMLDRDIGNCIVPYTTQSLSGVCPNIACPDQSQLNMTLIVVLDAASHNARTPSTSFEQSTQHRMPARPPAADPNDHRSDPHSYSSVTDAGRHRTIPARSMGPEGVVLEDPVHNRRRETDVHYVNASHVWWGHVTIDGANSNYYDDTTNWIMRCIISWEKHDASCCEKTLTVGCNRWCGCHAEGAYLLPFLLYATWRTKSIAGELCTC